MQLVVASVTSTEAPESSADSPKPGEHLGHVSVPCHFPNPVVSAGGTGDGVPAAEDAHRPAGQSHGPSPALRNTAGVLGRACAAGG